ncbi:imidazole glycerol phosphate synthase subunit HisH [Polyangium sp. 15x6]|uniref:imidazole glycerol phosphate synthase subunit HisH n=1 Tax=Polyangium sp. 15x6 TaxID=3042687 RepID=UPI00249AA918|nr:imidazole glycerol phosphate synthase subunit HisH [Polyangium sp. 15x6]MDI3283017.1 imidazole glycerol phosphate synthase subunit HisH [Polyangium sp. 15x6]
MARVVVVDLGMGNLRSVERAITRAAEDRGVASEVVRSGRPEDVLGADKIVVPGQGAFRDCAAALAGELGEALREAVRRGTPYLGICLGLQALFETSEEAPGATGLGVFRGAVRRLDPGAGADAVKIPHIGWNRLEMKRAPEGALAAWGSEAPHVYFVHSYHAVPEDPAIVVATVTHGPNVVTAAVARDNVTAVQFHPEKSQGAGLALLGAFVAA